MVELLLGPRSGNIPLGHCLLGRGEFDCIVLSDLLNSNRRFLNRTNMLRQPFVVLGGRNWSRCGGWRLRRLNGFRPRDGCGWCWTSSSRVDTCVDSVGDFYVAQINYIRICVSLNQPIVVKVPEPIDLVKPLPRHIFMSVALVMIICQHILSILWRHYSVGYIPTVLCIQGGPCPVR